MRTYARFIARKRGCIILGFSGFETYFETHETKAAVWGTTANDRNMSAIMDFIATIHRQEASLQPTANRFPLVSH